MTKRTLIWLAIVLLVVFVSAGIWHFLAMQPDEGIAPRNSSVQSQDALASKASPVLGKDFPGLPEYCADELISVTGCGGKTEITTDQGNTYRLVEIGNQCWFADNLKEIPSTDQGWYGYYDNADEEAEQGGGMLYTWEAAMNGEAEGRAQGICPEGWHVPSVCELGLWLNNVDSLYTETVPSPSDMMRELGHIDPTTLPRTFPCGESNNGTIAFRECPYLGVGTSSLGFEGEAWNLIVTNIGQTPPKGTFTQSSAKYLRKFRCLRTD